MDLDLESARAAKRQFLTILFTQFVVALAPVIAISVFLFLGKAQNLSQLSFDNIKNLYIDFRLEPNDGLAGLAVIAAVVLALSLDGSVNNYHEFRYSEFIYAYNIKRLLLVISGIIVNLIAIFSLIDLILDLLLPASEVSRDPSFASILVILSAVTISILSAARVRHRGIEGSRIGFQIKMEQENLDNNLLINSRRRGSRVAPWQRFRPINALYVLVGLVVLGISMITIAYVGTGVLWNPWQTIGVVVFEIALILVAPLLIAMLMFYAIRSKQFMVVLATLPVLFVFVPLSIYLIISGWEAASGYPALTVIWAFPAFMLIIGLISLLLPPLRRWPWWGKVFYPVNKIYYLIEQDFEHSRAKTCAISIAQLSKELNKIYEN